MEEQNIRENQNDLNAVNWRQQKIEGVTIHYCFDETEHAEPVELNAFIAGLLLNSYTGGKKATLTDNGGRGPK